MAIPREVIERKQTAKILHIDDCSKGLMRGDYSCSMPDIDKCQGYDCPKGYYKPKSTTE